MAVQRLRTHLLSFQVFFLFPAVTWNVNYWCARVSKRRGLFLASIIQMYELL